VAREFPDAVLLALWLNSANLRAGELATPETILASGEYGLLPAFIDGMLVILLIVSGQRTSGDACWFDNLELYHLGQRR
jgi:hypothetical protein